MDRRRVISSSVEIHFGIIHEKENLKSYIGVLLKEFVTFAFDLKINRRLR